jgi:hypothetical protein
MLNERRRVAEALRDQLHEAELAVEEALTAIGRLTLSLPVARSQCNISPTVGQAIFDSLGAAVSGIVEVRGHVGNAHHRLEEVRGELKFPVVGTGAGSVKPSSGMAQVVLTDMSENTEAA